MQFNLKFSFYAIITLLIFIPIKAEIITVKQDGTGDFNMIQPAINEATSGDTVLVYPGIYYENLDFLSKAITLGSLTLTTGEIAYRDSTIIDGSRIARCITIDEVQSGTVEVNGFTIRNGKAYSQGEPSIDSMGGGIFLNESNALLLINNNLIISNNAESGGGGIGIINCEEIYIKYNLIKDNKTYGGGGIYSGISMSGVDHIDCYLIGNSISNNQARIGGGVASSDSPFIFDSEEKNSVYMNKGTIGADIAHWSYYQGHDWYAPVYLDTFTVSENSLFYSNQYYSGHYYDINITFEHHIYEEIDADLYVSPIGNDNNSGLSPEEPLQTIWMAMQKIKSNRENKKTIHLAEGIYSTSLNNQVFPIQIKSYVNIIGEGEGQTILDGEDTYWLFENSAQSGGNTISNMTIKSFTFPEPMPLNSFIISNLLGTEDHPEPIYLTNLTVKDFINFDVESNGLILATFGRFYFHNCTFENNEYCKITLVDFLSSWDKVGEIVNTKFINNEGYLMVANDFMDLHNFSFDIKNSLFSDNEWLESSDWYYGTINIDGMNQFNIINTTIANNTTATGGTICSGGPYTNPYLVSNVNIINSIMVNNSPRNVFQSGNNTLRVRNSLIDGGQDFITTNNLIWLDGNIDANPMFDTENEEHPYSLSAGSPCINAGTADTTGLNLPEFDLAGNPRIFDGRIDIGCYEFQEVSEEHETEIVPFTGYKIKTYPNPFLLDGSNSKMGKLCIEFNTYEESHLVVDIFNIRGQKVKNICDSYTVKGKQTLFWDATDDQGQKLASGQYFIKMKIGKDVVAKKMLILK